MKQVLSLLIIASTLLFAACATHPPAPATHGQFPMARGPHPVKSIAILPAGNDLGTAIGAELERRGFTVATEASAMTFLSAADAKASSELYIPGRVNAQQAEALKKQFHSQGIDAILVLKADGFAPRRWREYDYWQTVGVHLYTTHPDQKGPGESYWGWVNIDHARARSAAEAATEIVTRMAAFASNPL